MSTIFNIVIALIVIFIIIRIYAVITEKRERRANAAYEKKWEDHVRSLGLNPENRHPNSGVTMFPKPENDEIIILVRNGWIPEDRIKIEHFHADLCSFFFIKTGAYWAVDFKQRKRVEAYIPARQKDVVIKYYDITDAERNPILEFQSCNPVRTSNYCAEITIDPLYGTIWCRQHQSGMAYSESRLRWSNNCAERGVPYKYEKPTIVCLDLGIEDGNKKMITKPHYFIFNDDDARCYRVVTISSFGWELSEFGYDEIKCIRKYKTYNQPVGSTSLGKRSPGIEIELEGKSSPFFESSVQEIDKALKDIQKLLPSNIPTTEVW